jgi:hypothetical protein
MKYKTGKMRPELEAIYGVIPPCSYESLRGAVLEQREEISI